MPALVGTYSFTDVQAALAGPGGVVNLGADAGAAEEGITIEMIEDKDTMIIGSDGSAQHNLNAGNAARAIVRLLKISPINYQLQLMYNFQKASAATWGQNTLTISDLARGDVHTLRGAAFTRQPRNAYGKQGPALEWELLGAIDDSILGIGAASIL